MVGAETRDSRRDAVRRSPMLEEGVGVPTETNIKTFAQGGRTFRVIRDQAAQRKASEDALVAQGFRLPLEHRCAWAAAHSAAKSWFVEVGSADGKLQGGFAVVVHRSR